MQQLITKMQYSIPIHSWKWLTRLRVFLWCWQLDRRKNCATVSKGRGYVHKIDTVGEIIEKDNKGWITEGCLTARIWCVQNGLCQFDVVERYISSKDRRMHFVFAFKYIEDAMAFKLAWT